MPSCWQWLYSGSPKLQKKENCYIFNTSSVLIVLKRIIFHYSYWKYKLAAKRYNNKDLSFEKSLRGVNSVDFWKLHTL